MKEKEKKPKKPLKEKMKDLWQWLRKNLINKEMLLYTLVGEAIFWIPVWVPALLAIIVDPQWWTAVSVVIVFWAGPFTPAIPLQLALIFALKKLHSKIRRKKNVNDKQ